MEQTRNPYTQRPKITEVQVEWAKKSNPVMGDVYSRLDALEQAVVEIAETLESGNKRGRVHKLLAKLGIGKNG